MKKFVLSIIPIFLFLIVQSQTLHQGISFTFDDNNPVPSGNHIFEARDFNLFKPHSEYVPTTGNTLIARINPYLLFPPPDDSLGGPNPGDNGQVGTLASSLDVSPSGAANYFIPLDIPEGVAGMKPTLSLQYNSQSGNGLLGIGWALGGLSSISRTSTDFYHDGPFEGVNGVHFNQHDQFVIDGQRLIDINETNYGSDGAEYRTVVQSFVKVISYGTAGNGPSWFEVWTKDGKIIEYGSTSDSRIEAPGRSDVLFWLISKITDRQGNYISFEYNENGDMTYSPHRIIYTGNSSVNHEVSPFYAVEFIYKERPDPFLDFLSGTYVNTNLRLSKIDIRYLPTSELYKEYVLTYTNDVNTTINSISNYYSHLKKVEVNDGHGTHLNPTTFEWGTQPLQFEHQDVLDAGAYEVYTGDFNGDGLTDIIKAFIEYDNGRKFYTGWELWLAYSSYTNSTDFYHYLGVGESGTCDGCQGFVVGDFNGDGLSDLLGLYDNWWDDSAHDHLSVWLSKTGSNGFDGFYPKQALTDFTMSLDYRFRGVQVGDFDGDGLDDIAVRCSHKSDDGEYDDKYDCRVLLSNFDATNNTISLTEVPSITNINRFYVGNFFDKTRKDLLILKEDNSTIYYWNEQLFQFTPLNQGGGYPTKYHTIFPADFNGDGITDILTCGPKPDFNWDLIEFTGKEEWPWPPVSITFLPHTDPNDNQGRYRVFPSDYNGDGKADIMSIDSYTHQVKFFFSKGKGEFINPPETTTLDVACVSSNQFTFNDFNGDGIADILYFRDIFSQRAMLLVHPFDKTEFIQSVTNGLGKKDKITYTPLSTSDPNIYYKYNTTYGTSLATVKDFQGPLYIVNKIETDNGQGSFLSKTYGYQGAHIQRMSGEFLGFSKIATNDLSTSIVVKNTFNYLVTVDNQTPPNSFYFPHLEKSETWFNQHLIGQIDNIYKAYQYFPGIPMMYIKAKLMFPYLTKSNAKSWETNGTTYIKTSRSTAEYNAADLPYGNPTKTSTLNAPQQLDINDADVQFTFKEDVNRTYYSYDEANWVIGNVNNTTTQTFIKDHGLQTKASQLTYYPVGDFRSQLLWKDIIEPGTTDPLSQITEFDYYHNGNLISNLLSAPNGNPPIPNRLTTYDYDPVYQSRLITKTTDPLGHFTQASYDVLTGDMISKTDINNLTTTYSRNLFETYHHAIEPDGTQNIKVLRWVNGQTEAPVDALFFSWEQTSGIGEIYIYYDKLGRILRKVTKGFDNRSIFVDQEYDAYGKPTKTSDPYFSGDTHLFTEKKYNTALPRVDYIIYPDQTHLWYTYQGPTTITTNEAGQTATKKQNALGLMEESTDANSQTVKFEYSYDGNDLINNTKIQGHDETQTTVRINKFGNRIQITDPSSGTIDETYDAFGELISRKDQKQTEQNKTLYTYDLVGRMITRREDGQLTNWTYDNKPFGVGSLDKVSNDDHSVEYFYDVLGRVAKKDESIPEENNERKIYSYKYKYDSYSRLFEQTYPSDIIIRNHYNSNGYQDKITEVENGIKPLWETSTLNAKDQLTQAIIGNIINTDYTYQPATGNLTTIHSFTNNNVLQDLEYQWDNIGNLTDRTKWLNPQHTLGLDESFQYDILNRLNIACLHTTDNRVFTSNFNYDNFGNITDKPPLTNMSYGAQNSGPYAITSANFTGDAISTNTQNITYTVFDKISTISEGESTLAMTYGIDHERIKQIMRKNGEIYCTKEYIGGRCEKIIDDKGTRTDNFIFGPQGLFAIIVKHEDGQVDLNYILTNHLGSINIITDKSGQFLEELSFDPWGRRRNPTDWTYDNTPTTYLFDRGYTGHEHLDLFGLINMNGRAYDPVVGRFLSTDAFIQAPLSQNFNRYSYCINNPLKYTDPNGEFFFVPIIVGAIIGAYIGGTLANQGNANPLQWNYSSFSTWGYMVGGAVIGGVSGYLGTLVLTSGIPFASTLGIGVASYTSSMGMAVLSGGQTPISVGFGFGSYDFNNNELGYLGKKGNSTLENIGYGFGALANLSDMVSLLRGGGQNIKVNSATTKDGHEWWGHSSMTDENGNTLVSVGPDSQVQKGASLSETWQNSIKGANVNWDTHLGAKGTWSVELNNVSATAISKYASGITRWDLLLNSCVGHTTRALWSAGVLTIYALHPHMLNLQLLIRELGIYSSPYLYQIP